MTKENRMSIPEIEVLVLRHMFEVHEVEGVEAQIATLGILEALQKAEPKRVTKGRVEAAILNLYANDSIHRDEGWCRLELHEFERMANETSPPSFDEDSAPF